MFAISKVYIAEAIADENGKGKGGEPGNQNGRELRITKWYLSEKGWKVLRPKAFSDAELIADNARSACANRNIGYDQGDRNTLYSVASKVGFDCAKVETPCETDCSGLVRVCCAYAGIKTRNFSTSSEARILMATDNFDLIEDDECNRNPDYLRKGDILVTKIKGHTAIVLNDGNKAYSSESKHDETPEGFVFNRILKYGCKGDDVKELKRLLVEADYLGITPDNPNYKSKTVTVVKRYQKDHGLTVDGKAGPETITSLGGIYI